MDENGDERASHKVGYGTKLFVKEGDKVARGDKLFEWDPYTLPIIAEKVRYDQIRRSVSAVSPCGTRPTMRPA